MQVRRRRSAGSTALPLVLVLLAACTAEPAAGPSTAVSAPVTAAPVDGDVTARILRVGLPSEPVSIDPRLVVDDAGELVARALFEGLVDVNPAGGIVPAAAATWRVSEDATEYRFALRRQTFHDGRPVTAADHAEAILAALDPDRPPYGREPLLERIRGARVPGPDGSLRPGSAGTVLAAGGVEVRGTWDLVLRLDQPDPRFLHALTDIALAPIPPDADADPGFADLPVGNGPFRLVEPRGVDGFLRLIAVTGHHRQPRVDELLLQFYPEDLDGERRWADLEAGRLQIARVGAGRLDDAEERYGRAVRRAPGPTSGLHADPGAGVYAYAFDVTRPPFDDVRLRRAIAAAIDRGAVASAIGAGAVPATRLLPSSLLPDNAAAPSCVHCASDPELARRLLAEWAEGTGATLPVPLSLTYPRRTDHAAIAEVVARQLEEVLDVRVVLRALDLAGLAAAVEAGEAGLFRPALRATLPGDAAVSSLLDPAFRAAAPRTVAGTGWGDGATDALLDRLRTGGDAEAAAALDVQLTASAVVVPLVWLRQDLVATPAVRGFALDPTGRWWPELVALG